MKKNKRKRVNTVTMVTSSCPKKIKGRKLVINNKNLERKRNELY